MKYTAKNMYGMCFRKKALSESKAQRIIEAKAKEGMVLEYYGCPLCQKYHLTKKNILRKRAAHHQYAVYKGRSATPIAEYRAKHELLIGMEAIYKAYLNELLEEAPTCKQQIRKIKKLNAIWLHFRCVILGSSMPGEVLVQIKHIYRIETR